MAWAIAAAKRLIYGAAGVSGVNALLLKSAWRRRMLLALGYHGVSLEDEHEWSSLYMPLELVRERFERIRERRCNVLPLGEAVERLYQGTLPPRAVTITFDDGFYDFYARGFPLLQRFGWPVTVYLTTYYSYYNVPVFDPMVSYLLWKGRRNRLTWPEMGFLDAALDEPGRESAAQRIKAAAKQKRLSGREKDGLLHELAERLNIDIAALVARRILHLMTPEEAGELAQKGVDFELHCHRHRVYRSPERFRAELKDNQQAIEGFGARKPVHFCYPGGFHLPEIEELLEQYGVQSATTCQLGLADPQSPRLRLPRLIDTTSLPMSEFSGWLSGFAAWVPRRRDSGDSSQLDE